MTDDDALYEIADVCRHAASGDAMSRNAAAIAAAAESRIALADQIEAARAGAAGRGFSVVANEVKALANETGESSGEIIDQVDAVQLASEDAIRVLRSVTERLREMRGLIDGIAQAVDGDSETDATGLAELAGVLRTEVQRFLTAARA